MKSTSPQKPANFLERLLSYPGIDEEMLTLKKNVFMGNVGSVVAVGGMTVLGWVMSLPIIVLYGFVLLALTFPALYGIVVMKKNIHWLIFPVQLVILLATMGFMLRMGGLLHSAGLIFTGISVMFMSINMQKPRLTVILFITYLFTLVFTALMQQRLIPAPELTPGKNLLFFTVNFAWQAGFTLQIILNNIKQKKELAEANNAEAMRLQELDEVKSKLFTNITHEFRTPLTILLGMADMIEQNPAEWTQPGIRKIRSNSHYLLHLVNQMLDLAKLESKAMPLHVYQQDIIAQLRFIAESFSSMAAAKNIRLTSEFGIGHLLTDYDADKLMQVITNLVSNAIKFTQEGGAVTLSASLHGADNSTLQIRVKDNGPGISQEHLPHIFDRFYRIEDAGTPAAQGSGLGLTLTREMVKLMNGHIEVESEPGNGTSFTVMLPVTRESPVKEMTVFTDMKEKLAPYLLFLKQGQKTGPETQAETAEMPLLLMVEDNADLVEYMKAVLGESYRVLIARNGEEGLRQAFEHIPDIILSDIMMPVMDGIAMLDVLKNDMRTSHIPVVLLTAKADIASKLIGLQRGADAYLAKPFNKDELMLRLQKLIELRVKLRQRYAAMEPPPATDDRSIVIEDEFMSKIRQIMNEHLDNDEFGIVQLCRQIGMSRAQLYRKFKTLTDKTVNEYLLSYRLFRAKELLATTDLNVSEVATDVGYKNLSHFSRAFTKEFGKNPSEFHHKSK